MGCSGPPWLVLCCWGDMKVEQTIQRVSKGPGGHVMPVLWHSSNYIKNVLNFLTTNHPMNHTECHLQHALSITRRHTFNQNVVKLLDFVLAWQNPYSVTANVVMQLHNVLTKLALDKMVAARLIKNCHSSHYYLVFVTRVLLFWPIPS